MHELDKMGLESCPFEDGTCDKDALIIVKHNDPSGRPGVYRGWVSCEDCGAHGPETYASAESFNEAASYSWNRRAATTSAGVTEEQVEAAAKYMARDHAMSGNRSMEATEEHVAKHWQRYLREARDILTAVWLDASPSKAEIAEMNATTAMELKRAAEAVCWFDWSDNDADAVAAVDRLRAALEASRVAPVSQKEAVPVAWRWRCKNALGEWSDWSITEQDPNDWLWPSYWKELEVTPLYTSCCPVATEKIKALEWQVFCSSSGNSIASTPIGDYVIQKEDDLWILYLPHQDRRRGKGHDKIEVAKAVAQAHLDAAIRTALHPTPSPVSAPVGDGIAAIAAERRRQIEAEGWTLEHDDQHKHGEISGAAVCYIVHGMNSAARHGVHRSYWEWDADWFKPTEHRRNLVKAGALIAAEIDRLDRAALRSPAVEGK